MPGDRMLNGNCDFYHSVQQLQFPPSHNSTGFTEVIAGVNERRVRWKSNV